MQRLDLQWPKLTEANHENQKQNFTYPAAKEVQFAVVLCFIYNDPRLIYLTGEDFGL